MARVNSEASPHGIIKHTPEDFVVEEIDRGGSVCSVDGDYSFSESYGSGDFLHAVLVKRNIDTISAVRKICDALGVSDKRVTYAGVKDKAAVTAQRISFYKLDSSWVSGLKLTGISIYPLGHGDKVFLGDLSGNRFTICVRGIDMGVENLRSHIGSVEKRLDGVFPNYFGEQRFGSVRPVTVDVGIEILKGDIGRALEVYVSKVYPDESDEMKKIRVVAWKDKARGLELFPKSCMYERLILSHLVDHDGDYRGAFLKLPLGLRKMFVHSVQSHIFNVVLSRMIKDGVSGLWRDLKIPIAGYLWGSRLVEEDCDAYIDSVMSEMGIEPAMFRITGFDELSSKGEYRTAFQKYSDFQVISVEKDDVLSGSKVVLQFSIPKGSYATVFLREFFGF